MNQFPQWIVSQIGSRELYACPLSLHREGSLKRFYTDLWCKRFRSFYARLPAPLWGISRRYHPELPPENVTAFTCSTLLSEGLHHFNRGTDAPSVFTRYLEVGKRFGAAVTRDLAHRSLDPKVDALFAFSTGALEPLQFARQRGLFTVVDQLDPGKVDEDMIAAECARWPGWEALPGSTPAAYYDRLAEEWLAADRVVVNSEFSRKAIHEQGVPLEKIVVVPLAYEPEAAAFKKAPPSKDGPLTVLWLGQVVLRKGIPYLFEAARLLKDENIRFQVAGRIGISELALKSAPPNVQVLGRITREQAIELYKSADLFVLPTISDGFAITQLEAMSYGLPVITTRHCGDVVTPGEDGHIIPIRDPVALAQAILRLHQDRAMLEQFSAAAQIKSRQFTLQRYAQNVNECAKRARSEHA